MERGISRGCIETTMELGWISGLREPQIIIGERISDNGLRAAIVLTTFHILNPEDVSFEHPRLKGRP